MRMIDRIKQAMRDTGVCDGMSDEDLDIAVTASLEAMREPNDAMITAGRKTCITTREQSRRVFNAMIDAALNE